MEDVGIFYGHLVYFKAIWYFLWSFGTFSRSVMLHQENSGNPASKENKHFKIESLVFRVTR
jgi:hypothetical protein